jgi:hypothetical protein
MEEDKKQPRYLSDPYSPPEEQGGGYRTLVGIPTSYPEEGLDNYTQETLHVVIR